MASLKRGSLTFTEQYIVADRDTKLEDYEKQILQELKDNSGETVDTELFEAFVKNTRFIYQFFKSTLTKNVIDYIKNILGEDRSDIMVFITLASVLLGDSRNIIENMPSCLDPHKCSEDELKYLMNLLSYIWRDEVALSEQRRSSSIWGETLRNKGTEDAFMTTILYNVIGASMSQVIMGRDSTSTLGVEKMTITSPYTQFSYDEGAGYVWGDMTAEEATLLKKLEQLRPLGVYVYYTRDQVDLKKFVYWKSEADSDKGSSPTFSLTSAVGNFISIAPFFTVTEGSQEKSFIDPNIYPKYDSGLPMTSNYVSGILTLHMDHDPIFTGVTNDHLRIFDFNDTPVTDLASTLMGDSFFAQGSTLVKDMPYMINFGLTPQLFPVEGYATTGDERLWSIHFVGDAPRGLDYVTLFWLPDGGSINGDLMHFDAD